MFYWKYDFTDIIFLLLLLLLPLDSFVLLRTYWQGPFRPESYSFPLFPGGRGNQGLEKEEGSLAAAAVLLAAFST
jgi:hypothetical protein